MRDKEDGKEICSYHHYIEEMRKRNHPITRCLNKIKRAERGVALDERINKRMLTVTRKGMLLFFLHVYPFSKMCYSILISFTGRDILVRKTRALEETQMATNEFNEVISQFN